MASFTDNLPVFKEYVQQQPVEAMLQVGQIKQQRYDEGIQKIQSQIDKVAGMDVVRDVDKQYLQSKLNTLGGDLRKVAAGDFSNYQLVNSVGGMINTIGKDRNVQNAVGSTMRYRKGVVDMETAIKEGKSSPANIDYFNKEASKWFNSENPGEKFNGSYIPYFDVDKFVKETFDAVKPDGYTSQQLYLTDDQGNIVKDKRTGQPILSPVMSKLKQEGRFPKKVQETLDQIFLDPRVQQQLSINGEYAYKGLSPDQLKGAITSSKNSQVSAYDEKIRELNLRKSSGEIDPSLDSQIDDLNSEKVKISTQFDDIIQATSSNPDYVRALLYKENVRDNYKSMYTNINEERLYEENPIWNQNFKMQQEANDMAIHRDDLIYKYTALAQDDRQFQDRLRFDINKAVAENKLVDGSGGLQTFMPTDIDLNNQFDRAFGDAAQEYTIATDDLLFSTVFNNEDEISSMMRANRNLTREQVMDNIIRNTAAKNGETPESFRTRWSMKALNKLNNGNPDAIDQSKLDRLQRSQKNFGILSKAKENVTNVAGDLRSEYVKNLEPIQYSNINLNPQDQYDMALVYNTNVFSDKGLKDEAKKALERLKAKGLDESYVRRIVKSYKDAIRLGNNPPTDNFLATVDELGKPGFVQSVKDRADAIKSFYQFNPILSRNLAFGKEVEIKDRYDQVAGLIGEYQRSGQNLSEGFSDNVSEMAKIANDPKNGTIRIETTKSETSGEITPKFTFYDSDGKFAGEMTVTPQQANAAGFDISSWYKPDEVRMAELKLSMNNTNTTNIGGLQRIKDPYTYRTNDILYSKNDFPNLRSIKGFDVKANIAVTNGQYFSYIYVFDKSTGKEVIKPLNESKSSMDEALQLLNRITPQIIQAIITENQK